MKLSNLTIGVFIVSAAIFTACSTTSPKNDVIVDISSADTLKVITPILTDTVSGIKISEGVQRGSLTQPSDTTAKKRKN